MDTAHRGPHGQSRPSLLGWLLAIMLLASACPSTQSARKDAGPLPPSRDGAAASDAGPDGAPPEDWRSEVVYLVMTDRFHNGDPGNDAAGLADCFDPDEPRRHHGGDLRGLRDRIGYLRELGVSAVWITPLYEQSACGYHGYWADYRVPDDGAIEPKLGTAADVEALIAALHDSHMKLVLDMIVNHAGYDADITEQRPGWFHDPTGCEELGDPDVTCPLSRLPDFAQEQTEVADYLVAQSRGWLERFAVDGVRMDTAKHVPLSFFGERWLPAARQSSPELFVVAEVFEEGAVDRLSPFLEAGFDSAFHFPLRRTLIEVFAQGRSTDRLGDRMRETIDEVGMEGATWLATFLDNHDVPRWLEETADGAPGSVRVRRYHLALTALFTLPGIPTLYYGDELGLWGRWPDNRRDMPEWAWNAADRAGQHPEAIGDAGVTFELVRRLIDVRGDLAALQTGYFAELWRPNGRDEDVYVFFRAASDNRVVVAFNNGDAEAGPIAVPVLTHPDIADDDRSALADGTVFRDRLSLGAPMTRTLRDGHLAIELPPRSAAIYVAE